MSRAIAGTPWSGDEIDVILESYFRMLTSQLTHEKYVKSRENQYVQAATGRSRGSIEHKYMNVSSVLIDMALVHIDGYKPERNIQAALRDAVADHVARNPAILDLMDSYVRREAPSITPDMNWDLGISHVPTISFESAAHSSSHTPAKIDFVAREAANRSLGLAGELVVVSFEKRRLLLAGRADLAAAVEHIARTRGDGAGFDVLSFDAHTENEKYIEVKTTRRSEHSPFYVSRNEISFSRAQSESFALYRLFRFDSRARSAYILDGALDRTCSLEPTQFLANPRTAVG